MKITITKVLKDSFLSALMASVLFLTVFTYLGPNIILAQTSVTDDVVVTLTVTPGISINSPSDVTMSRALSMANMTAVGSTTWQIKTNNITGYSLTVKSTSTPTMQNNASTTLNIADIVATTTPVTWVVSPGAAAFGFSGYGTDVNTGVWGSGGSCQSASHIPSTTLNYAGFRTSTSTVLATRPNTTTFAGTDTTLCFAVEQNAFYIPAGTYTATIIATAVTI
ncbi:MAG: hypothetical protein C0412_16290 [Flavobacterium sp.]|nr:hypothetical protein [Flavobacterium sp.]